MKYTSFTLILLLLNIFYTVNKPETFPTKNITSTTEKQKKTPDFQALLQEFQEHPGKKNIEKIYGLENEITTPETYYNYLVCIIDFLSHPNKPGKLFFLTKRQKKLKSEIENLIRKHKDKIADGKDVYTIICNISNKYIQFKNTINTKESEIKTLNKGEQEVILRGTDYEKEQEVKLLQDLLLRISQEALIENIFK